MARYTIELNGGGNFEVDAKSTRDARRIASRMKYMNALDILEVRPFAAKAKDQPVKGMPTMTVKTDPFEVLRRLLPDAKDETMVDLFAQVYVDTTVTEGTYATLPDDLKELDRKWARNFLTALAALGDGT